MYGNNQLLLATTTPHLAIYSDEVPVQALSPQELLLRGAGGLGQALALPDDEAEVFMVDDGKGKCKGQRAGSQRAMAAEAARAPARMPPRGSRRAAHLGTRGDYGWRGDRPRAWREAHGSIMRASNVLGSAADD